MFRSKTSCFTFLGSASFEEKAGVANASLNVRSLIPLTPFTTGRQSTRTHKAIFAYETCITPQHKARRTLYTITSSSLLQALRTRACNSSAERSSRATSNRTAWASLTVTPIKFKTSKRTNWTRLTFSPLFWVTYKALVLGGSDGKSWISCYRTCLPRTLSMGHPLHGLTLLEPSSDAVFGGIGHKCCPTDTKLCWTAQKHGHRYMLHYPGDMFCMEACLRRSRRGMGYIPIWR